VKKPVLIGILLLALGVAAFAYEGVTYQPGAGHLPLTPVLGVAALVAGTVLVIVGKRKRPVF
jgi:uncharacterized membrane protein HdeD (DUF308 family)